MYAPRIAALALLCAGPALAQTIGEVDAHGFPLVPNAGAIEDLMTVWNAESFTAGSGGVHGVFEYANAPFALTKRDGDNTEVTQLLPFLVAFDLAAGVGLHKRVGIGVSAPLYLVSKTNETHGPSMGDVRISVPVSLLGAEQGLSLSLVPTVTLPTGMGGRFLGRSNLGVGGVVAATYRTSNVTLTANVGASSPEGASFLNVIDAPRLLSGIGAAYSVSEDFAVRVESWFNPIIGTAPGGGPAFANSPGEALLSVRGRITPGLTWTAGGGTAVTRGVSAATLRAFVGIGGAWNNEGPKDTDGDGLVDRIDSCPTEPETVNSYRDDDGCPDELGTVVVLVTGPDGQPVEGALVRRDGQVVATTAANGRAVLADQAPGQPLALTVDGPEGAGLAQGQPLTLDAVAEGHNELSRTLGWLPGTVRVVTRDSSGNPVDAQVAFEGPVDAAARQTGTTGDSQFALAPGDWRLIVSAEGYASVRTAVIPLAPDSHEVTLVELTLMPTVVQVTSSEVFTLRPVEFEVAKARLRPDSIAILEEVAATFLANPDNIRFVEIQGHTDSDGSEAYNRDLSQRRMESVQAFLVGQGVRASMLNPVGYGETCPIATNATRAGKAANRRVQFIILDPEPEGPIPCRRR